MATLRNRNGKWQVQVRRDGHSPRSKTFITKRDAQAWARQTESEIDASALDFDPRILDRTTARELLERYRLEITAGKRGRASESLTRNASHDINVLRCVV